MNRIYRVLSQGLVFVLLLLALGPGGSAQAASTMRIYPRAIQVLSGGVSSNKIGRLKVKDQTGEQNDPGKFILFSTPEVVHKSVHSFRLPDNINTMQISKLILDENVRAPGPEVQLWTWSLYNWKQKKYVRVGTTRLVIANTWTTRHFGIKNPRAYISAKGQIRVLFRSNNKSRNAAVDFESFRIRLLDGPALAGCPMFPVNNIWNARVDSLSVHQRANDWIDSIGRDTGFHMDFGSGTWAGGPIGIPYNVVSGGLAGKPVTFYYPDESDPGPYPIPNDPKIEHGSDHHILILEKDNCVLYELFDASYTGGKWYAGSGAVWNLKSNALRPDGWTSADAAGLPILPGLVRYDEVAAGAINHAIRFTVSRTQRAYLWPARHFASSLMDPNIPPMGARFRLKASFDISGYPPKMRVILRAMKQYGIIVADNGSDWLISGAPDPRWDNDMLHLLDNLSGDDFEAVDVSGLMIDPDSGRAR